MQVWAVIIELSYLREREDMKLGGDHREVEEEIKKGTRVGYGENTSNTCMKYSKRKNILKQNYPLISFYFFTLKIILVC